MTATETTVAEAAARRLNLLAHGAREAAANAGPKDGDKLIAALTELGIPAFFADDCGVSYVLVGVDCTTDEGDAHTGPKVFLYSGENADLEPEEHTEPWTAALYDGEGEYIDQLFTVGLGLDLDTECAHAALYLTVWLAAHAADYPRAGPAAETPEPVSGARAEQPGGPAEEERQPGDTGRGAGEGVVYGRLPGAGGRAPGRSAADVLFSGLAR
ncbi:hypothetical protein ACFY0A_46100 [Streptomyces sp. NPDC001698]|uniref:hypothetical protein n=1 Tax=Streptomyces sp. NPDC001698 TaxID=3364601 RepID=UPI0036CAE810